MAKEAKNKKENKRFFKDFKAELKKVIWPTPKQLVNNTVAVITIVLITAVIVFALDFLFERMNTYGINAIKQAVESKNEISNEAEETADEETNESDDSEQIAENQEENELEGEEIQELTIEENSQE